MFYTIDKIDQTIVLTFHPTPHFETTLHAACNALLDLLDAQPFPVFLIVDARKLSNIACNALVDKVPARPVQIMFAHPRIREVIITAPDDIYSRHAKESMYKPYSTKPILITASGDLARGYAAEALRGH